MYTNEIVQIAAEAGKLILENGGETYRVEDTIVMICNAYKVHNVESFVTPTGIIVSVTNENNEPVSIVKRIHSRTVNLEKISLVNNLSRKLYKNPRPLYDIKKDLERINNLKRYNNTITTICSGLSAGFFTLLFGGTFDDFGVSLVIGILIMSISMILNKLDVNSFLTNILGGALAELIALLSIYFGIGSHLDKIVIGSIMLLVPGLAITNAIRDTIAGDLVSGVARSIEAFFVAIAIAIGTGVVYRIWFILLGGVKI